MQYSNNIKTDRHKFWLTNNSYGYIWVSISANPNTTYSFTITGKTEHIYGRAYMWIGNTHGKDIYNKKKYLTQLNDTHTTYYHNTNYKILRVGICLYKCHTHDQCYINKLNIKIKQTNIIVYQLTETVEQVETVKLIEQAEQVDNSVITFGKEVYTTTENIKINYDMLYRFIFTTSKESQGIQTIFHTTPHSKYMITIQGNTHFKTNKYLYLLITNSKGKAIHFKPIIGIGCAKIIIKSKRNSTLRLAIYNKGTCIVGDHFDISNIHIQKIKKGKLRNDNAILILGDFAHMEHAVALNRINIWKYIAKRDSRVVLFGTNHPQYRDGISIDNIVSILKIFPQIIIHLQYNMLFKSICRGLCMYRCLKRVIMIEDMHRPDILKRVILNGGYNHIMYNCDCAELDIIKNNNPTCKFIHQPHFVDTNIFTDYRLAKKWDIIFYGTHGSDWYPFRNRLYTLLLNCTLIKTKFITFTGYSPDKAKLMPRGVQLAKLINQSWISIATTSRVDYFVKKYIEIPACNTMIAGNIPTRNANICVLHYYNSSWSRWYISKRYRKTSRLLTRHSMLPFVSGSVLHDIKRSIRCRYK